MLPSFCAFLGGGGEGSAEPLWETGGGGDFDFFFGGDDGGSRGGGDFGFLRVSGGGLFSSAAWTHGLDQGSKHGTGRDPSAPSRNDALYAVRHGSACGL